MVQKLKSLGFAVTKAGKTRGENWSKTEVANTVDDYFEMLQKDLRGQPYNKTDHRSHLITKLNGRTDGAIEMKHQNISAVLNESGMTYIPGYKPRGNYQGVLADAVEEYLNQQPDFYSGTPTAALPSIKSTTRQPVVITLVLVDPPTPRPRLNPKSPPAFQPRHYDFVQRDAKNRDLGKAGEEFVIRFEKQRLVDEGRRELADRVEWVSKTRGDGAGYDVASFNADGSTRFIEVKTTNCGKEFPFILTENEITFSKLHAPNYYLYRVFDFARDPHFFIISGDLDQNLNLRPKTFEASFWLIM